MIDAVTIDIWNREFTLPVEFEQFDNAPISVAQSDAVKRFLTHSAWITTAKRNAEEYCRKAVMADTTNSKKDNIFSYVKPQYLFVKQDKHNPRVAIMCKYRYEPEHGLAIVFSHEGQVTVGIQDIIL